MAVHYNQSSTLVTNSLVDAVITTGMTTTTNGDVDGRYVYQGTINLGGCGNPNSAVFVRLKDTIPWTKITCFFEMTGTAACWAFMGGSSGAGSGEVNPATAGLIAGGNLEQYNSALGDRVFRDTVLVIGEILVQLVLFRRILQLLVMVLLILLQLLTI